MLIVPYSTALTLGRPPYASYAVAALCAIVYTLQLTTPITEILLYYPGSWNPLTMVSASFAHIDIWHLLGNLVFFMAFAPALEILIDDSWRYFRIMLFIALVVGVAYSFSVIIGGSAAIPTLGLSGVVMGMIGLSAYLMPRARIRVLFWYILLWKTFFVPAWALAVIYIGLDAWRLFGSSDYSGVNLVAHVAGGLAGYGFGLLWMKDRRNEIDDELAEEIEAMRIEQKHGKTRAQAHRYQKAIDPILEERARQRDYDKFMGQVYQMVKTHRDADAIMLLLERYNEDSRYTQLEPIFERAVEWGQSRFVLCLGRMIIDMLDREQRHGRVLMLIEQCQQISPGFILPDVSRTLFFAQMALDTGKSAIARHLLTDAARRYGRLLNAQQCNHLLQKAV